MTRLFAALALVLALAAAAPAAAQTDPYGFCASVVPQRQSVEGFESAVYRRASNRDLRLHVLQPTGFAGPRPAILFFFGGGWRNGDVAAFSRQARAFAARGYVAILADYRVQCRDKTSPLASVEDARAVYDWVLGEGVARHAIDAARVVLSGASSGGHLALMAAIKADRKPAALLLFNPAIDLVGPAAIYLKPFARGISPSVLPLDDLPPMMILQGKADSVTPYAAAHAYCGRINALKRTCLLVGYDGAEHGFFYDGEAYDDTLRRGLEFLEPRIRPSE
ncbi:MAG: alpha/beta hydrolase [Caulobacter sp.]|nr:alpha/beta hydrolase [Caulobacter sp.]